MTVRIMLATNDHRNGMPTGRVDALQILDVISLEGPIPGPRCLIDPAKRRVRIAGMTYPIEGYAQWVGNWCWDEVRVSDEVAVDILDRLRKTELWTCTEAESAVYGKWERGEKIVAEDLSLEVVEL